MQKIWDGLHSFAVSFEFAIAGFIGGIIGALLGDRKTKRDFIVFVIAGTASAHYLTALVARLFTVEAAHAGGYGFLIGAVGGSLIAALIRAADEAELWPLFRDQFSKVVDRVLEKLGSAKEGGGAP